MSGKIETTPLSILKNRYSHLEKKQPTDQLTKEEAKMLDASRQFEGQFLNFMIQAMERTIHKEGDNKQSLSKMMFSSVMGKEIAENGGIGLADFIFSHMKKGDKIDFEQINKSIQSTPMLNNPDILGERDE